MSESFIVYRVFDEHSSVTNCYQLLLLVIHLLLIMNLRQTVFIGKLAAADGMEKKKE